jgi:endoglucanase
MRGELSGDLPRLGTVDRFVVSLQTGAPLRLRGVNRSGLEYAVPDPPGAEGARGFLEAVGISEDEIATITREWGANVIRIPFTQDFALNGSRGRPAEEYLGALDMVIAWAARHGCYTLLDLQWLDDRRVFGTTDGMGLTPNRVPPLPDASSVTLWTTLARRYVDEPAVLFDLFNEPHDLLADDPHGLLGIHPGAGGGVVAPIPGRRVGMAQWQPWARHLISAIRAHHPLALIFVSGIRWAYDLRGMPLIDATGAPLTNIVYSTHVYPWLSTPRVPLPWPWRRLEDDWERAFGHLAARVPVFAAEWGGEPGDLAWGMRLRRYLDTHDIGWTAWSWSDWPHLVADARGGDHSPTTFGQLVREALKA